MDEPTPAQDFFAEQRLRERARWIERLTEVLAQTDPAEAIDGPALLAVMREHGRPMRALEALAAALVAGGALAIEDAADAIARASRIDTSGLQQARASGHNSGRRR